MVAQVSLLGQTSARSSRNSASTSPYLSPFAHFFLVKSFSPSPSVDRPADLPPPLSLIALARLCLRWARRTGPEDAPAGRSRVILN